MVFIRMAFTKIKFTKNYLGPLFFECLFYKPTDHSWNPLPGNKIDFYSFYYYFLADPPEHRKWIRLPRGLVQDGDRSVPLRHNFFKSRNLVNFKLFFIYYFYNFYSTSNVKSYFYPMANYLSNRPCQLIFAGFYTSGHCPEQRSFMVFNVGWILVLNISVWKTNCCVIQLELR